jgi:hypothetical protein
MLFRQHILEGIAAGRITLGRLVAAHPGGRGPPDRVISSTKATSRQTISGALA